MDLHKCESPASNPINFYMELSVSHDLFHLWTGYVYIIQINLELSVPSYISPISRLHVSATIIRDSFVFCIFFLLINTFFSEEDLMTDEHSSGSLSLSAVGDWRLQRVPWQVEDPCG